MISLTPCWRSRNSAYLGTYTGQPFDALVTGVTGRGTWVRTLDTPVEGKLVAGFEGLEVGDRVRVRLESIDPSRGYVDFFRAAPAKLASSAPRA